jgi:predicted O-linked N-acetylglucosamine transferase (SPINDLY family)
LRIGYVSPDFRDHALGWYILPLFRCHDHRDFEILCYSGTSRPDFVTAELQRLADGWRSTVDVSDADLAEMIRQDGIDIRVDLAQHTGGNRLPVFARRPAPVQVSFAGYPGSAGLEQIEYRLSDRWLEGGPTRDAVHCGAGFQPASSPTPQAGCPHHNAGFKTSEGTHPATCILNPASYILPLDTFWCHDPSGLELEINPLPAQKSGRVTFGCLNNFCKVNHRVLGLWARVLTEVPDSRLILLARFGSHRERTLQFFARAGIDAGRIEFVTPGPRKAYLEYYHRLDIALDTFPYSGHMTSLDTLWMGVPLVTLPGPTVVSRGGLSILHNLDLAEFVAHSEGDYVRIAAELAGDLPRLAHLRATLRARMESSVLMDVPHFTRQVETAYREMWSALCSK